jgi:flagellar M-ring protein FliF
MVGAGRVRATVTADLDFTVTEETHENYDPQKTAVRSEQTSSEMRKGGDGVEGIPGALSNQPPGTSGAPVIPGAAPTPGRPANGQDAAAGTGPSLELAAQHAQLRGRSHAVVRQAAGGQFESA